MRKHVFRGSLSSYFFKGRPRFLEVCENELFRLRRMGGRPRSAQRVMRLSNEGDVPQVRDLGPVGKQLDVKLL